MVNRTTLPVSLEGRILTVTDAAGGPIAEDTAFVEVREPVRLRVGGGQRGLDLVEERCVVDGLHVHIVEDLEMDP